MSARTSCSIALLAVALCIGASAHTEADTAKPASENMKVVDGFGAQVWFVDIGFIEEWLKGGSPRVKPVKVAERGKHYLPAIIIAGAAPDKNNNADVTYDITIYSPDGSIYGEQKALVGWNRQVDSGMQLCEKYLTLEIEPTDPAGIYKLEVMVRDNVRKLEVPLKTSFEVKPR